MICDNEVQVHIHVLTFLKYLTKNNNTCSMPSCLKDAQNKKVIDLTRKLNTMSCLEFCISKEYLFKVVEIADSASLSIRY